jgi:pyruvate-formate lyase-activating enzyme
MAAAVHLVDIINSRTVPAAGLYITLTRRCPLGCEHCATNSLLSSEQHSAEPFERFVATFTPQEHPDLVWFTGGEPLLRPALLRALAGHSRAVGAGTALITGGYFARDTGKVSSAVWAALTAVDHVAFSLDVFHERKVARSAVFATASRLLEAGQDVSFQVLGTGPADPYLREVTDGIRTTFNERVPALVVQLDSVGRGKDLVALRSGHGSRGRTAAPCTMASWPVIGFDGTVVACCNQEVVDGPAPSHLRVGSAATDDWRQVATRMRTDAVLRSLRVVGPEYLTVSGGGDLVPGQRYCGTCRGLTADPAALAAAARLAARPTFAAVEEQVVSLQAGAGAHGFAARHGISEYADLVLLGYGKERNECAS